MDLWDKCKSVLLRLLRGIEKRGFDSEMQFIPLAILGLLGFPIYYIFWHKVTTQDYESLYLRLSGFVICLVLAFKNYWPQRLRFLLPYYWYFTLFYTLSFFFAFMLFQNNSSNVWLMTTLTGLVLLMLVTDWVSATIIFILGIFAGWAAYAYTANTINIPVNFFKTLPTYITVLIAGSIFVYRSAKLQQEKLQTMRLLGTNIAHELRTPLAAINMTADGVKEYWPHLIDGYNLAKQHALPVHPLRTSQFNIIQSSIDDILAEAHYANNIINMLLLKANEFTITARELKNYSIAECINEALRRYPFAEDEKKLVHWNAKIDFVFNGNELFMIHVLFNLLKNALYYIHAARKGEIYITLEKRQSFNKLIFRDTGSGIPAKYMKHLFDRFFSKTHGGTGLGLTFAKMVMQGFGGEIVCRSKEGEFTEFTLSFPVLPEAENLSGLSINSE